MKIDFDKNSDGLVPAIIQDAKTKNILMLGYMNEEALQKTQETKQVTFYSRSKQRLWTKGETSGNFLELVDLKVDKNNLIFKCINTKEEESMKSANLEKGKSGIGLKNTKKRLNLTAYKIPIIARISTKITNNCKHKHDTLIKTHKIKLQTFKK